ncbi:hypothetical protein ANCDUO_17582, partial [Ancylostoma duodenale]
DAGIPNARNLTSMFAFFSQVVAYEIMASTATSCPLEIMKIPVPPGDPVYDIDGTGTNIPFTRAKYDKQTGQGFNSPREQVSSPVLSRSSYALKAFHNYVEWVT